MKGRPDVATLERTLVILKPDALQRGLAGRLLQRFEDAGLKIVGMKMKHMDADFTRRHYFDLADRFGESRQQRHNRTPRRHHRKPLDTTSRTHRPTLTPNPTTGECLPPTGHIATLPEPWPRSSSSISTTPAPHDHDQ
jgi:Nucleoside diphosphate kinase